jgi:hypothetical protein
MPVMSWGGYREACRLAGPWLRRDVEGGWFPLDLPLPKMRTCCYMAVDADNVVLYIGRVRRRDLGGIRSRFSRHHRRHAAWHAVWIVPLLDATPAVAVDNTEAALISIYQPPENGTAPIMKTSPDAWPHHRLIVG